MPDQKLSIQIETTATGQGVQQTAAGLEKLSGAAQKAAPAVGAVANQSKATAQELGRGVEVGNAATNMVTNLAAASNGGASGLLALARGGFGAGVAIKGLMASMGPMGAIAAGIGIALGLVSAALRKSEESADEAKKKIDELNKAKLDALTQQEKALTEATKEATDAIDKQLAAADKLADMRTARLIEEEKARGKTQGIAPEITDRNIARIRRDAEDAKIGRQQSALEQKAEVLGDSAVEAEQKALDEDTKRNLLLAAKARRDAAAKEAETATTTYMNAMAIPGGTGDNARDQQIIDRYNSANEELAAAQKAYAARVGGSDKTGELYKKSLETADAALNATKDAAKAARKAADDAASAAAEARKQEIGLAPERAGLRAAENTNARPQTDAEKAVIERLQEKRAKDAAVSDFRMKGQGADVYLERAAAGASVDAEQFRRVFPKQAAQMDALIAQRSAGQAAAAKPTGGTIIGPDGRVIPVGGAVAQPTGPSMIGPDGRPVAVQSGQPTGPGRGAYREEGQGGKSIVQPLQDAAKAIKDAPTGEDTVAAAKELKQVTESATQAQKAASDQTVAALTDLVSLNQGVVDTLTPIPPQITAIRSEIQKLWGAVRSASRKSTAA